MDTNLSRRNFLVEGSILASGLSLGISSLTMAKANASKNKIRIGVIGTGSRGGQLTRLIKSIPELEVIACCDIYPPHLKNALEWASDAKGYQDYRDLLDYKDVDAVIIATPLNTHSEIALDAIDAGKHVYLEKTLTYNIAETLVLAKKVQQSKKVFQAGFQRRIHPLLFKVHEIIKGGYIGEIAQVMSHYNRNGDWRREVPDPKWERLINWRMYKEYSGGLMAELCSHQIDIVNWMLDANPLKVKGMGGIDFWKDGRETFDNVHAIYEYPKGVKATYTSLTTNSFLGFNTKFMGSKGSIELWNEDTLKANIYFEPNNKAIKSSKVDATTGATSTTWVRGEAIAITMEDVEYNLNNDAVSTQALMEFANCIKENKKTPNSNIINGGETSIATLMCNMAMDNGSTEVWKPEYNLG